MAKVAWAWMACGALMIGAIVAAARPRYSYGGPDGPRGISRDPRKLIPTFAAKLETLFQRMRKLGFDPFLHEAYRTPERAAMLAKDPDGDGPKKAPGIKDSLHSYGAAVDIISCSRKWEHPSFFKALGRETKKLGLFWGGDFGDADHIQAVPPTPVAQNGLRAARDRDAYVRRYIG